MLCEHSKRPVPSSATLHARGKSHLNTRRMYIEAFRSDIHMYTEFEASICGAVKR